VATDDLIPAGSHKVAVVSLLISLPRSSLTRLLSQ
jgi:hypothetical protein